MFSQKHLALRTIHLKGSEKWVSEPEQMLFVFPKQGRGFYTSRLVKWRLLPGEVLVLNSANESEVRSEDSGEFIFYYFSVCPEHIFPLFSSSEISLLRNVAEGFKATRLHGAATAVAQECHRLLAEAPPLSSLEHRGQLLRVVAAVLDAEVRTPQPHLPGFVRAEDHLLRVIEALSADELINASVGELAARFGWSKRHLNRMFHSYFGLSVAAMKMEMRLLRAVSLLRDPDVKIISVAESCGFNYLGFFNTCFKKRFGVTPSQRRKMMVEMDGQPVRIGNPHLSHVCPLRALGLECGWLGKSGNPQRTEARKVGPQRAPRLKVVISEVPSAGQPKSTSEQELREPPRISVPHAAPRDATPQRVRSLAL